mgnify:CR=1 FL=1
MGKGTGAALAISAGLVAARVRNGPLAGRRPCRNAEHAPRNRRGISIRIHSQEKLNSMAKF